MTPVIVSEHLLERLVDLIRTCGLFIISLCFYQRSLPVDSEFFLPTVTKCILIWFLSIFPQLVHNLLNELEEHLKTETMKPVRPFLLINQKQTVHFLTDSTLHFILNAGGNVVSAACTYAWPMTELCAAEE